jgi:hypothetical protein
MGAGRRAVQEEQLAGGGRGILGPALYNSTIAAEMASPSSVMLMTRMRLTRAGRIALSTTIDPNMDPAAR